MEAGTDCEKTVQDDARSNARMSVARMRRNSGRETGNESVISHHSSAVHATMGRAHSRLVQVTASALAKAGLTLAALLTACATVHAQATAERVAVAGAANLQRQEGVDAGSG